MKTKEIEDFKAFESFISTLPEKYYILGRQEQAKYITASNKLFKNKEDREILDKYKYTGVPPLAPNYKLIAEDFKQYRSIMKKYNFI